MLRASIAAMAVLVACPAVYAAQGVAEKSWSATSTPEKCTLIGGLVDVRGNPAGQLEIHWMRSGSILSISLLASTPLANWRFDAASLNERLGYQTNGYRYISIGGEAGDLARRELVAGRALTLIAGSASGSHRLTTGTGGAAEATRAFDQCVAAIKAIPEPPPPPPRWTASTQGGRDCSLGLSDVSGVRRTSFGIRCPPRVAADLQRVSPPELPQGRRDSKNRPAG